MTRWILMAGIVALIVWDVLLASNDIPGDTISEVTLQYTGDIIIPVILGVGFLLGHLFWPQRRK